MNHHQKCIIIMQITIGRLDMKTRISAKTSMYDYQVEAINNMKNGCILCGGVGTGKSRTSLAYYYMLYGGKVNTEWYVKMTKPCDLYIITTAHKRDIHEWDSEIAVFSMNVNPELSIYPKQKVVIDSWNNIKKYKHVKDSFFIFDEQRVVGGGTWVKNFLRIAKVNKWILLSATPGDTWSDYIPVFLANGFYKNRTEFLQEHAVYSRFSKFPKIEKFMGTNKLLYFKNKLLVDMHYERKTIRHYREVPVDYDRIMYKTVIKDRWDPFINKPIENPGSLCYLERKICNSDESRADEVLKLSEKHNKLIVFYNFTYEKDILKSIDFGKGFTIAEWNGQAHEPVPDTKKWIYLVQYTAGCEGWNCVSTNAMIFYSQNYSYKVMEQASGRIDRLNTKYIDLYYYTLKCKSSIDLSIARAIRDKKKFNETKYCKM